MRKNVSASILKNMVKTSRIDLKQIRKVKPKYSYWNWVDKGVVTPIRGLDFFLKLNQFFVYYIFYLILLDQQDCGSCYAFSIVSFYLAN